MGDETTTEIISNVIRQSEKTKAENKRLREFLVTILEGDSDIAYIVTMARKLLSELDDSKAEG